MKSLLKSLVDIPAPPGHEHQLREKVQQEIEPLVDEMKIDRLGNLLARKGQAGREGKRMMIVSHLDEIGVIATHVDQNGFIRFTKLGGVNPKYLPGGRVRFLHGTRGMIDMEGPRKQKRIPGLSKMYIDIGLRNPEDSPVEIGDPAVFERVWLDLGQRIVSKALDDRVGVAVMIEVLRRLKIEETKVPHELWMVFSVQEEVTRRGSGPAAFQIAPDLALAVDVTATGDTPQASKMEVSLGQGPAVKIRDKVMLSHPGVVKWMISTAEQNGIPYQREVLQLGTTDAASIQISRGGVPSGCLSIPCRYIHSPSEMVDWGDVQYAVDWLMALLVSPFPTL